MKLLARAIPIALFLLLTSAAAPPTFAFYCEELLCFFYQTSGTGPQSWDFGDGFTTDPQNPPDPFYIFDQPGVYPVTLTTPQGSVTHPVTVQKSTFNYPCVLARRKCRG